MLQVLVGHKRYLTYILVDRLGCVMMTVLLRNSWTDPDSIALMVMQSLLGSWNKSAGGGKHMGSVWLHYVLVVCAIYIKFFTCTRTH